MTSSSFRAAKSLLNLGDEFQGLSYDLTVSSTALVFTRYIILEWMHRKNNDQTTGLCLSPHLSRLYTLIPCGKFELIKLAFTVDFTQYLVDKRFKMMYNIRIEDIRDKYSGK